MHKITLLAPLADTNPAEIGSKELELLITKSSIVLAITTKLRPLK